MHWTVNDGATLIYPRYYGPVALAYEVLCCVLERPRFGPVSTYLEWLFDLRCGEQLLRHAQAVVVASHRTREYGRDVVRVAEGKNALPRELLWPSQMMNRVPDNWALMMPASPGLTRIRYASLFSAPIRRSWPCLPDPPRTWCLQGPRQRQVYFLLTDDHRRAVRRTLG